MSYDLLSHQKKLLLVHRNRLISFHPVVPLLEKTFSKKNSPNPHTIISSFNPAKEIISPEQSPIDSLEDSDNETTKDSTLTDRCHNSKNAFYEHTSSPIMLDNSQHPPTTPIGQTNIIHTDSKPTTSPPAGNMSAQISVFSPS